MPFDSFVSVNEYTVDSDARRLGAGLRKARRAHGLSQRRLAEKVGIDIATVQGLEGGKGTMRPLLSILDALAHRFSNHQDIVYFGPWIAAKRKAAGFSQESLARLIGLSKPTIIQIERGHGNIQSLVRLMAALKLSMELVPKLDPWANVELINGDCLELLPRISGIHLAITSPPYLNIGMEYGDYFPSIRDYVDFSRQWISLTASSLTPNGSCWINIGHHKLSDRSRVPLTYYIYPILQQCGLTFIQEVVWDRRSHLNTPSRFSSRSERWMFCVKNPKDYTFNLDPVRVPPRPTSDIRGHPLGASPADIWEFCAVQGRSKERTDHPCQFPQAMIERIVLACSKVGDVVLDPFSGSGTTGLAAISHGRRAILIERDPSYCELARKRIATNAVWPEVR